jgi:ATP-dependent RNA helicase SUPV3L1/SUV3
LRKYGVRFGAYHIYIPGLLKPAPRSLATQLFALKDTSGDLKGLDDVQALASSGRTSIPLNKEIAKALYRTAGYRVCGERAVRVDILERLADLIRPALAWRENAPGVKPAGALDGRGFTVTVGMTSLAGSSGEDFASILRSLGYRMDRRPKPPETPAATDAPAEAAPAEAVAAETSDVVDASEAPVDLAVEAPALDSGPADLPPEEVAAAMGIAPAGSAPADSPSIAPSDASTDIAAEPIATETQSAADTSPQTAADAAQPAATEEFIEVWRPGRFENRERHHRRRPNRERHAPGQAAASQDQAAQPAGDGAPAQAADGSAPAADGGAPQRERHHRRRDRRGERHERGDGERPQHGKGKPRFEGKRGRQGHQERQGHQGHNEQRFDRGERRERAERQPDPNSPFAKLAALKAQLEADSKERR